MTTGAVKCVARDGRSQEFYYRFSIESFATVSYKIRVYASRDFSDLEFFELAAENHDGEFVKITMITHNRSALYAAKGIPDALIPVLADRTGKLVRSSSQRKPAKPDEYRTDDATKVGRRLVERGSAIYCESEDFFVYI